jgi:exosome complex RNA-binding protein Csl4
MVAIRSTHRYRRTIVSSVVERFVKALLVLLRWQSVGVVYCRCRECDHGLVGIWNA